MKLKYKLGWVVCIIPVIIALIALGVVGYYESVILIAVPAAVLMIAWAWLVASLVTAHEFGDDKSE